MMSRFRASIAVLGAAALLSMEAAAQTGPALPAPRQAQLLARVLAYNRTVAASATSSVVIAVVYQPGVAESESAQRAVTSALSTIFSSATLGGLPVKVRPVSAGDGLESAIKDVSVLYLCPGLDAEVASITKLARSRSIFSATGTEAYVTKGVSVGLITRGPKPTMLVNLTAARAEGAELESGLLRLAEVVQ